MYGYKGFFSIQMKQKTESQLQNGKLTLVRVKYKHTCFTFYTKT